MQHTNQGAGRCREIVLGVTRSAYLWIGDYLGEVDELLEEVSLQIGGAGLGVGQVEVAGNLGDQGRVAIVLAIPAGRTRLITVF